MSTHPFHDRLVSLAAEYLTAQWCTEMQLLAYLAHNVPTVAPLVMPTDVRDAMLALGEQGVAEGASYPGDRVLHWRRRQSDNHSSTTSP